ncbi:hypothetical protein HDU98_000541 [Podochytrium sp. JEL0797]|nr:hypothetical protein HDU98_000541 [Podochytrium sp. JEL0797]
MPPKTKAAASPATPQKQKQPAATYVTPVSLPRKRRTEDRKPADSEDEEEDDHAVQISRSRSPSRRVAQRVSQQGKALAPPPTTVVEKDVLRKFDLDMKFGLDPPMEILDILNIAGRQEVEEVREGIWHDV